MGLDMYLFVEKYESKFKKDKNPCELYPQELRSLAKKHLEVNFLSVHSKYQIGYWRKFYPLHHWFVNYSHEEDYCQEIIIYRENLQELLKHLKQVKSVKDLFNVLDPNATTHIENDWESYYLECLQYTIKLFERVLRFINKHDDYEIIYKASW